VAGLAQHPRHFERVLEQAGECPGDGRLPLADPVEQRPRAGLEKGRAADEVQERARDERDVGHRPRHRGVGHQQPPKRQQQPRLGERVGARGGLL